MPWSVELAIIVCALSACCNAYRSASKVFHVLYRRTQTNMIEPELNYSDGALIGMSLLAAALFMCAWLISTTSSVLAPVTQILLR